MPLAECRRQVLSFSIQAATLARACALVAKCSARPGAGSGQPVMATSDKRMIAKQILLFGAVACWRTVSDSGSQAGVTIHAKVRSGAVSMAAHNAPASAYTPNQASYSNVCAVRDRRGRRFKSGHPDH
jgi:hypothetical protein